MASKYAALHEADAPTSKYAALHEDDSTATRSDAGPEYGLAFQKVGAPDEPQPQKPDRGEQLKALLSMAQQAISARAAKEKTEDEAVATGAATVIPKMLGVRNDLGNLGAAAVDLGFDVADKWSGIRNAKTFGEIGDAISRDDIRAPKDSSAQVKQFYKSKDPMMMAVGEGLGTAPIAPFRTAASAIKAAPFASKLLTAAGSGVDAAAIGGVLGYRDNPDTWKEAAILSGLLGTAGALVPEAITSIPGAAKEFAGRVATAPKAGMAAMKRLATLGWKEPTAGVADDAARSASEVTQVTPLAPIPEAGPAGPYSREELIAQMKKTAPSPEYDTAAMKLQNAADDFGKGDLPPAKDPEFLRKSSELAKMLGQNVDEAAAPVATKPPRGGAPKDPRSRHFKYGADEGKTVLDREEQIADWDMGMLGEDGRPWFSSGQKGLTPEERAALMNLQQPAEAGESVTGNVLGGKKATSLGGEQAPTEATRIMGNDEVHAWLNARGFDDAGNKLYDAPDIDRIMADVNAAGAQNKGGWYKPTDFNPPAPPVGHTRDAEAARLALGGERLRKAAGFAGAVSGGYTGAKVGGLPGVPIGAAGGKKAWQSGYDWGEKASEKMHEWGQKILKDQARLTQIAAQGGQMGKAAEFILDGARTGGESGMAARAYVIGSQPWWREQFADEDSQPQ